jgi:signal transduction histidine kinase
MARLNAQSLEPQTAPQPSKSRWPGLWRLQSKLIVPYVLLTLILAALGTFVVTKLVAGSLRERLENQMKAACEVALDGVRRRERTHLEELRAFANTLGVDTAVAEADTTSLDTLLRPIIANTGPDLVTVTDVNGRELITWGRDLQSGQYATSSGYDFSGLAVVQRVLSGPQNGDDKFTDIVETLNGPAFITAATINAPGGDVVGVMLIGTLLDTLSIELEQQAHAAISLMDLSPRMLSTTLPQVSEVSPALEALAAQADPQNAQAAEVTLYGRPYQVMYVPWTLQKETLGWLGVVFSSNFLVSSETTNRLLFTLIFATSTIGVILVGYVISQHIARPILRLRSMSQAVAAGNLNQRIGLQRADEIGDLADAFDVMTDHLRERTEEAERLYQETIQRNRELAEINAQLQATQLQLIQSEKLAAIGQLTAGIVHDVKNPLAVIKGMAELLEEDFSDPDETRRELRVIRDSADKASRIVSDLLKFARQSSSELQPHDLRETVDASLRLTDFLLRQAHVKVAKNLPSTPVMVNYDPQQIEQVLINMIHNAIQAMPDRGSLQVRLARNDGNAFLDIQDSGSGIAPQNLKRIFDPFFTTKPEGQGTGLGLSVSYGIIANHNGHIDVQSELGQGTTFTIVLPAIPTEEPGLEIVS